MILRLLVALLLWSSSYSQPTPPDLNIEYVTIWVKNPDRLVPHLPHILQSAQKVKQTLVVDKTVFESPVLDAAKADHKLTIMLDTEVFSRPPVPDHDQFTGRSVIENVKESYMLINELDGVEVAVTQSHILRTVLLATATQPTVYHDADVRFGPRRKTHLSILPDVNDLNPHGVEIGLIGYPRPEGFPFVDVTMLSYMRRFDFLTKELRFNTGLMFNKNPGNIGYPDKAGIGNDFFMNVLVETGAALESLLSIEVTETESRATFSLVDMISDFPNEHIFESNMAVVGAESPRLLSYTPGTPEELLRLKATKTHFLRMMIDHIGQRPLHRHLENLFYAQFFEPIRGADQYVSAQYKIGFKAMSLEGSTISIASFLQGLGADLGFLRVMSRQDSNNPSGDALEVRFPNRNTEMLVTAQLLRQEDSLDQLQLLDRHIQSLTVEYLQEISNQGGRTSPIQDGEVRFYLDGTVRIGGEPDARHADIQSLGELGVRMRPELRGEGGAVEGATGGAEEGAIGGAGVPEVSRPDKPMRLEPRLVPELGDWYEGALIEKLKPLAIRSQRKRRPDQGVERPLEGPLVDNPPLLETKRVRPQEGAAQPEEGVLKKATRRVLSPEGVVQPQEGVVQPPKEGAVQKPRRKATTRVHPEADHRGHRKRPISPQTSDSETEPQGKYSKDDREVEYRRTLSSDDEDNLASVFGKFGGLCSDKKGSRKKRAIGLPSLSCMSDSTKFEWDPDSEKVIFKAKDGNKYVAWIDSIMRRTVVDITNTFKVFVDRASVTAKVATFYANEQARRVMDVSRSTIHTINRVMKHVAKKMPQAAVSRAAMQVRHMFEASSIKIPKSRVRALKGWFLISALVQLSSTNKTNKMDVVFATFDAAELASNVRLPTGIFGNKVKGFNNLAKAVSKSPIFDAVGRVGAVYGAVNLVIEAATGKINIQTERDVYFRVRTATAPILAFAPSIPGLNAILILMDLSMLLVDRLEASTKTLHHYWRFLDLHNSANRRELLNAAFLGKPVDKYARYVSLKATIDALMNTAITALKQTPEMAGIVTGYSRIDITDTWSVLGDGEVLRGVASKQCLEKETARKHDVSTTQGVGPHVDYRPIFYKKWELDEIFIGNLQNMQTCRTYFSETCRMSQMSVMELYAYNQRWTLQKIDQTLQRCPLQSQKEYPHDVCKSVEVINEEIKNRTMTGPRKAGSKDDTIAYPSWYNEAIEVYEFPRGNLQQTVAETCQQYPVGGYYTLNTCHKEGQIKANCTSKSTLYRENSETQYIAIMSTNATARENGDLVYRINGNKSPFTVVTSEQYPAYVHVETTEGQIGQIELTSEKRNTLQMGPNTVLPQLVGGGKGRNDQLLTLSHISPPKTVEFFLVKLGMYAPTEVHRQVFKDAVFSIIGETHLAYTAINMILNNEEDMFRRYITLTEDVEEFIARGYNRTIVFADSDIERIEVGTYSIVFCYGAYMKTSVVVGEQSTVIVLDPTARVNVEALGYPINLYSANPLSVYIKSGVIGHDIKLLPTSQGAIINGTCMPDNSC